MISNLMYILDYSYRGEELKSIYIISVLLLVIRIIVPIILIVTASIDLIKSMLQNNEEIKKIVLNQLPKVISAIIIFILPSMFLLLTKSINFSEDFIKSIKL